MWAALSVVYRPSPMGWFRCEGIDVASNFEKEAASAESLSKLQCHRPQPDVYAHVYTHVHTHVYTHVYLVMALYSYGPI